MKYIKAFFLMFSVFTLASCDFNELDYTDFEEHLQESYVAAETKENKRYLLYYYGENCSHCKDVKQEVLSFFTSYELTDFYILNVGGESVQDVSRYDEFLGTPCIFFIADGEVVETYTGSQEIREFLEKYEAQELTTQNFELQVVSNTDMFDQVNDNSYLVYYYNSLEDDFVIDTFLEFAFSRGPKDVYFVDYSSATLNDSFINLGEGPILLEMSYDIVMDQHNGQEILQFIDGIKEEALYEYPVIDSNDPEPVVYEYSDFKSNMINDYDQALIIDDSYHYEYYYSPNCGHCGIVKEYILPFFSSTDIPFYMFDVSNSVGAIPEGLTGVPCLWVVKNNEVIDTYVGSVAIPEYINNQN